MRYKKSYIIILSLAALCMAGCFLTGCAVEKGKVYEKDGKLYGTANGVFTEMWYDYYLRGFSYAGGKYWDDAISDFKEAIHLREKDKRRARTYGLHFINYFPNRELGIACFNLGKFKEAIQFLETSLESVESTRSKFYLNKARKSWLEQTRLDTEPPAINVEFPPPEYRTNGFSVNVRGKAYDNYFVSNITFNGEKSRLELSRKEVSFKKEFSLRHGKNIITLRSEDILGKTSPTVTINVKVDRHGPLALLATKIDADGTVAVRGVVYDESGLSGITLNGRKISVAGLKLAAVDERFFADSLQADAGIIVKAGDTVGNTTVGLLPAVSLKGGSNAQRCGLSGMNDGQVVFVDTLPLQGFAASEGGINDIVLNGQSLLPQGGERKYADFQKHLVKEKLALLFFSKNIKLREGENSFRILLADMAGKTTKKNFTVVKKIPLVRQTRSRMSMAVLPFAASDNSRGELKDYARSVLLAAFENQKRFSILSAAVTDRTLAMETAGALQFDLKAAAKLGRIMGVETVLTGEIHSSGDSVGIDACLVDTESREIIAEKDVYWEGPRHAALFQNLDWLALKFKQHFPLCEGAVIKPMAGKAVISVGQDHSVRPGMRFLAYDKADPVSAPGTGIDFGSDTVIQALLYTKEISPQSTLTDIMKAYTTGGIQAGDNVIAK